MGFTATVAGPDPDWDSDLLRRMLTAHSTDPVRIMFEEVLIPAIGPATRGAGAAGAGGGPVSQPHDPTGRAGRGRADGRSLDQRQRGDDDLRNAAYPPPGVAWKGCPAFLSRLGWQAGYHIFRGLDELAAVEYRKLGVQPRQNHRRRRRVFAPPDTGLVVAVVFPAPVRLAGLVPGRRLRPLGWTAPVASGTPDWRGQAGEAASSCFTLGSSVVNHPGEFWQTALTALARTDWSAILLGAPADLPVPPALRQRVQVIPYAPYADIFPQVDAVVHQGGVGTTQAACYYGVPSLVVPRGFDQFENAAHVQREGWGLRLMPQDFSAHGLRFRLERLLRSDEIQERVAALGRQMQAEPGVARSADLVEAALDIGRGNLDSDPLAYSIIKRYFARNRCQSLEEQSSRRKN